MGQDVCLIRTSKQNQRYLNYFLHSHVMRSQLALMSVGSTFERINVADIKHLVITVPPRGEQNAIATYLDGATAKIVQSVAEANRQVALVREYRTRLVADVVTGKLDVRDAAAHLPNEIDEELALDDSESLVDNEESGEGPSEISLEEVGDEP